MLDPYVVFTGFFAAVITVVLFYFVYCNNKDEGDFEKVYTKETASIVFNADKKISPKDAAKGNKNQKKKQKTPDATEDEQEKVDKRDATVSPPPASQRTSPVQPTPKVKTPPKQQLEVSPPKEQQLQKESPKEAKKKPLKVINPKEVDQKMLLSRLSSVPDLEEGFIQYLNSLYRDHENQCKNLRNKNDTLQTEMFDLQKLNQKLSEQKSLADKNEQRIRNDYKSLQNREGDLKRQIQTANSDFHRRDQEHARELQVSRNKFQQMEAEVGKLNASNMSLNTQLRNALQRTRDEQHKRDEEKKKYEETIASRDADHAATKVAVERFSKIVDRAEEQLASAGNQIVSLREEITQLEQENADLTETINATKLALDNQTQRDAESDSELATLQEEKKKWVAEKNSMIERYIRLEELMKELNDDIGEFHLYYSKESQEKIVGELKKRVADLTAENEDFDAREAELLDQVVKSQSQLTAMKKEIEQERARIVEIPKNSPEPESAVEEVFELKKTHTDLAAAPSTSQTNVETEKLEELRQRNMNLLEKAEALPEQLIKERQRVVTELSKLSGKKFEAFDDENAYNEWINDTVSRIETNLSTKESAASAAASPTKSAKTVTPKSSPSNTQKTDSPAPAVSSSSPESQYVATPESSSPSKYQEVTPASTPSKSEKTATPSPPKTQKKDSPVSIPSEAVCYKALQTVHKQLEHISDLYEKERQRHEETIAQLKAQIN